MDEKEFIGSEDTAIERCSVCKKEIAGRSFYVIYEKYLCLKCGSKTYIGKNLLDNITRKKSKRYTDYIKNRFGLTYINATQNI